MIKSIYIRGSYKDNWIDQNKVVFGYDCSQHCCEDWSCGVYDGHGNKVGDDIDCLPYHFDFKWGASQDEPMFPLILDTDVECMSVDWVTVKLLPDDETDTAPLYFVCVNVHNGYYYHDFSFDKLGK